MTKNKDSNNLDVETTFSVFQDVNSIPDNLKSGMENVGLLTSITYFQSLQESSIPGLSFRYVFLVQNNKPIGFYYFQVLNLSAKELGKIIHLDPYSKTLNHFSGVINAILFGAKKDKPHYLLIAGNMILSGEYGLLNLNNSTQVYEKLVEAINVVTTDLETNGKVVATIVKDFISNTDQAKKVLSAKSFSLMVMDPIMKMEIRPNWETFSDYLESLSAKYRLRYNNAKKKIESITIRDLTIDELIQNRDVIEQLYKAVQLKSPIQLLKCDFNYLLSISKKFGDKFKFRAYFDNEKMIAFMCGLDCNDHYEAHHIGIDYHYNRSHAIYLNILYEFIGLAIESSAKSLSFGRTALEMKTTVGAIPISYNAYIKLNNYMLNCLIKSFLPSEIPFDWTPRNPFKDIT